MKVVVTGAGGFIGRALTARLLENALATPVTRLVLCDVTASPTQNDPRIEWRTGDVADPAFARAVIDADTRVVFHLAGVVSGAAEADFARGLRANLHGTMNVLEAARLAGSTPRFVFSSSIAVFGVPIPASIDDATLPVPTLSYGAQKLACEQLVNDYSRRGFIDGLALRLSGVVVRPPMPNGALSAFNSDIFREPLAGRPITSPVSAEATLWILSIERAVDAFVHAARLDTSSIGPQRALTLPALAVSIREILDVASDVCGRDLWPLVTFAPNPAIEPMFGRWPRTFSTARADALGFRSDADLASIVRAHLSESTAS